MFWTCSFWITDVKGNGIVSACFVKSEDTSIHRKGTHLFIHMGNLEIFTLMVVQENLTSDVKVVFGWTSKVKLAKEEGKVSFAPLTPEAGIAPWADFTNDRHLVWPASSWSSPLSLCSATKASSLACKSVKLPEITAVADSGTMFSRKPPVKL